MSFGENIRRFAKNRSHHHDGTNTPKKREITYQKAINAYVSSFRVYNKVDYEFFTYEIEFLVLQSRHHAWCQVSSHGQMHFVVVGKTTLTPVAWGSKVEGLSETS